MTSVCVVLRVVEWYSYDVSFPTRVASDPGTVDGDKARGLLGGWPRSPKSSNVWEYYVLRVHHASCRGHSRSERRHTLAPEFRQHRPRSTFTRWSWDCISERIPMTSRTPREDYPSATPIRGGYPSAAPSSFHRRREHTEPYAIIDNGYPPRSDANA